MSPIKIIIISFEFIAILICVLFVNKNICGWLFSGDFAFVSVCEGIEF